MGHSLENKLVVAVSSRAVFDLSEANAVFECDGIEAYRQHQRERLNEVLPKGVAFPFISRLLRLNARFPEQQPVEVVVLSRNSPETGQRFFQSCRALGLNIQRGAFLSGQDPWPYAAAFGASLFLSAHTDDVRRAIEAGQPAGLVLPGEVGDAADDHELRIAFDFDGVLADDEAEKVYADGKLPAFQAHEVEHRSLAHEPGPLKALFTKIAGFQRLEQQRSRADSSYRPALRVAIVTARGAPAEQRLVTTLSSWGIDAAELYLMGGVEKNRVLEVLRPHIFFDDQRVHLNAAASVVPSVWIPFGVRNGAV